MKIYLKTLISLFSLSFVFITAQARPSVSGIKTDSLISMAEKLRLEYRFDESVLAFQEALDLETDSLERVEIEKNMLLSQNGSGMLDFVSEPVVVARHRFSLDEFFLYYPLKDKSWRKLPNILDSTLNNSCVKAVYFPEGDKELFFSAPDEDGVRNIYQTEFRDTIWSVPHLINEYITSAGDEIYPMLSPDGKILFFASNGLYGMGGYDLYFSVWNEEQNEWGPPSNMGFPYSSPYNDFLFINTDDGKYSVFASDRDCVSDSVDVYVLEYDNVPVRKSIRDIEKLRKIAALNPAEDASAMDAASANSGDIPENVDTKRYMDKISEVRALKDSIFSYSRSLDFDRTQFAESDDDAEREKLTVEILRKESAIPFMQDSLKRASEALQKIEMEFLFNGVILDPDKLMQEANRKVEVSSSTYAFTSMNYGDSLNIRLAEPEVKFDYTFMILPEGRFAQDNTLPEGIVYQIQLFSLSNKATLKSLKGLSPVFEEKTSSGRYIYRVGLFRKYNDVLSNLNKVRRLGFKGAYIAAFDDGKPVKVQRARVLEKKTKTVDLYQIKIVPLEPVLSDITIKAINQLCNKDIAKSESDGRVVFTIGTFDSFEQVENVVAAIKATGETNVETIKAGTREVQL